MPCGPAALSALIFKQVNQVGFTCCRNSSMRQQMPAIAGKVDEVIRAGARR